MKSNFDGDCEARGVAQNSCLDRRRPQDLAAKDATEKLHTMNQDMFKALTTPTEQKPVGDSRNASRC